MIVVADTSVLINLCCIRQDDLLRQLFEDVVTPPEVAGEFDALVSAERRFAGLRLPPWIRQQAPQMLNEIIRTQPRLHRGEKAALQLALEISADLILLDEREAYAVARSLGLRTFGLIGVLLQSKQAGLIPSVAPLLAQLRAEANFWIKPAFRSSVLRLAGEEP